MNRGKKYALPTAIALCLTAGLVGCSSDAPAEEPSPDASATQTAPAPSPQTDAPTADSDAPADEADKADDAADTALAVTAQGKGPIGLTAAAPADVSVAKVSGKFIVGPGACFALTQNDGRPQTLVFGDDASFTLRDGKPSVTTDELGTVYVGERITLSAATVSLADVTGVPDRCTHGASEVLVAAAA